jgi:Na+-transporting methylmalonyl-CoA/oxaloacetate decarboxylase gamma subunit
MGLGQSPFRARQTHQLHRASEHPVEWSAARHRIASSRSSRLSVKERWEDRTFVFSMLSLCLLWLTGLHASSQTAPPASKQAPTTAPSTAEILSTYEGQNVTAIEVAGRPQSTSSQFASLFVQQAGQPFSKEKVDRTAAAIKAAAKCDAVQVQVEAEANGVRVLLVLEPAVYFGLFLFQIGTGR